MNTDLQQRAAYIESLQHAMQNLQYMIDQKDDKIKNLNPDMLIHKHARFAYVHIALQMQVF
jgi:hypothetical protein